MDPTEGLRCSKSRILEGKKILVGVTSSIGAIETPKLIREFIRHGAEVYTVATEESKKIVGEYALEFASGKKVCYNITGLVEHVTFYNLCDAMVIYPTTANTLSKISLSIGDNIVNTTAMMFIENKPLFIVPGMHRNMLQNVREHMEKLKRKKLVYIIPPKMEEGKAKVPPVEDVVLKVMEILKEEFRRRKGGKRILILTGGTAEFIDKVRVITNLSSGKTGYYLAETACREGHHVEVIYALGMEPPYYVKSYKVITSREMLDKALEVGRDADIIISCAAISDFIPEVSFDGKIRSDRDITIKLKKNVKVIRELRKAFPEKTIVGFKAEYGVSREELVDIGKEKLKEYDLDYIVVNDLARHYFGDDYNEVVLIGKEGVLKEFKGKKYEIMEKIIKEVVK
ncbi:MAG TPA: bifunctional phosphopantothenoylcysteine decarboxylase/phosphopantothenate--cysteine ligase CoaBC [Methanothermococcus okinawensis]|nr:bifunctional phosphopantothenoylcysteine decarboxylase/phosphopantothenate--cysteine ligase CoaBC [Methanothermococcus okinawensis]